MKKRYFVIIIVSLCLIFTFYKINKTVEKDNIKQAVKINTVNDNKANGGISMYDYSKIQDINYPKVKSAFDEKIPCLTKIFNEKGIKFPPDNVIFVAYKKEMIFELWANGTTLEAKASHEQKQYTLISQYEFTKLSGKPGPKRKEGDKQVPEGFYYIDRFNPDSKFYLALGTNYPNKSDKVLGDKNAPGSDIFIHGSDRSVGCIPLGDDKIKEIYTIADIAKTRGQKQVPVYIFPCRMSNTNFAELIKEYRYDSDTLNLWNNLKTGYDIFEQNHEKISYSIDDNGKYIFEKQ